MALKDLFVKKQQSVEKQPQQQADIAINTSFTKWGNTVQNQEVKTESFQGKTDYVKYLEELILKNNQPGLDFLEFMEAINDLSTLSLSESQKYQATIPTYIKGGVTPQKLIESGLKYLNVLEVEADEFEKSMRVAFDTNITQKENQVKTKQQEIEKLATEIQNKNIEIQNLNSEINSDKNELSAEENAFEFAYKTKTDQINDQITKIKTYLLNGTTTKQS